MRFTPKTEEELKAELMFPVGEYDFEIAKAEEKTSNAGNEMIVATVKVFGSNGSFRLVTDYLMEKMAWKLRHFCEATGLLDKYEAGTLTARDCEGRTGRLTLQIDPERKSPDGEKTYAAKNSVRDYTPNGGSIAPSGKTRPAAVPAPGGATDMEEDDIPF